MLYCSKPGDFAEIFHAAPLSIGKVGPGPRYAPVHCVLRRTESGEICLLAMNAYALPVSFEVYVDAGVEANGR
jgi:hypothetical protein